MSPLVTIMIATYNQPAYIKKAVESALSQHYERVEVIVSDDSTNNDTRDLLEAYSADRRFYYYKNEQNIGRVNNYRRLLYELAKGEWVVMLDGDDYYIDPSFISKAINTIQTDSSLVLVGAGHKIFDENNNKSIEQKLVNEDILFDGTDVFMNKLSLPQHSTDMYRRSLACQLDFYRDHSAASDTESLMRLCLHGKVAYLSSVVAVWRIHHSNETFSRSLQHQVRDLDFVESIYRYAKDFIDVKILKEWRFSYYKGMSYHLADKAVSTGKFANIVTVIRHFYSYWGVRDSAIFFFRQLYKSLRRNGHSKMVFK